MRKSTPLLILFLWLTVSLLAQTNNQTKRFDFPEKVQQDTLYPPVNLQVDTLCSKVTWEDSSAMVIPPDDYYVYLDSELAGVTDTTVFFLPYMEFNTEHEVCVKANYNFNLSDPACEEFISGYLAPPRNLDAESYDDVVHLWWEVPLIPAETEREAGRDQWDVHETFPCVNPGLEFGAETDGFFIYTTVSPGNAICKYQLDGTYVGEFTIPGVSNLRDLAYDPTTGHMFGGDGSHICWEMDFTTQTLIDSLIAPVEVYAIAYDTENDGFWACTYFSQNITLFDKDGNVIYFLPLGIFGDIRGLAYDGWSLDGPYLWGFSRNGSGAELVQYDLSTGMEIFNINVLPIVNGTQPAAGLFTHCNLYYISKTTIGGVLLDEMVFGLELGTCGPPPPPPGWVVPDNLVGYNVYRDDTLLNYVLYDGEDTSHYYDLNFSPYFTKCYEISAIYDVTSYGIQADTGESMTEGPECITGTCPPLPFEENWNSGSFSTREWQYQGNWTINGQTGNPEPAAEFYWDPVLTDYSSSLTSYPQDGINLIGDPYIDGCIYFDCEVKLDDKNTTGNEFLKIEVGNEDGWHTLATYDNSEGSFDWTENHFDITPWAFGYCFQIRFVAEGENSDDINSWFVDNIYVWRECNGPFDMGYNVNNPPEYTLYWNSPLPCYDTGATANRELQGYGLYKYDVFHDFTIDTFYTATADSTLINWKVYAVYEDCESVDFGETTVMITGFPEGERDQYLLVYPNPVKNQIKISSNEGINKIILYDLKGKKVLIREINNSETTISVRDLGNGVYSLVLLTEDGRVVVKKLVVMR